MIESETESLLHEWQKRLRLKDWEIEVVLVEESELADDAEADVDPHLERRTAKIQIAKSCADHELALVHELMHLWTRSLSSNEVNELIEEHAIEAIGSELVRLKRLALGRASIQTEAA